MDMATYEETRVPRDDDWAKYMKEGMEVSRVRVLKQPKLLSSLLTRSQRWHDDSAVRRPEPRRRRAACTAAASRCTTLDAVLHALHAAACRRGPPLNITSNLDSGLFNS